MSHLFPTDNMEMGFLPVLSLLVLGVLGYFLVSPGSYLADTPEVLLPLAIVVGLSGVALYVRFYREGQRFDKRCAHFGWLGLVAGGAASVWLGLNNLPVSSVSPIYLEGLTVMSLSTAVGCVGGYLTSNDQQEPPDHHVDRDALVAETTWAARSGSNPVVMEIVEQLAELQETDPVDIEPLGDYFDGDIFKDLHVKNGSSWQVLFYTSEYEIRVSSHGTVTIYEVQGARAETSPAVQTS